MSWYIIFTIAFFIISVVMTLIILVQRPQGGGLAGAFGGAGGGGTETVFGGRVGDALTWATVVTFAVYLLLAVGLNRSSVGEATAGPAQTPPVPGLEDSAEPVPVPLTDPTGTDPLGGG